MQSGGGGGDWSEFDKKSGGPLDPPRSNFAIQQKDYFRLCRD